MMIISFIFLPSNYTTYLIKNKKGDKENSDSEKLYKKPKVLTGMDNFMLSLLSLQTVWAHRI